MFDCNEARLIILGLLLFYVVHECKLTQHGYSCHRCDYPSTLRPRQTQPQVNSVDSATRTEESRTVSQTTKLRRWIE